MKILLITFGIAAIFLAWAFVFQRSLIFKVNTWMREYVFTDELALFSGKRLAALLLALGGVALFSGVDRVVRDQGLRPRVAARLFQQAQDDYLNKRYDDVLFRCRELIKSDPRNIPVWELMATALVALDRKPEAQQALAKILEIDPNYPINKSPLKKIFQAKKKLKK